MEDLNGILHHAQARDTALKKHIPNVSERYYLVREEVENGRLFEIAVGAPHP